MKDNINLYKTPKAIGKVCVELKNPETGEVVKKVEGYNHVWTDNLFTENWYDRLWYSTLCLTCYDGEFDENLISLIPGNLVGYGYCNSSASGNFQGAYQSNNSYIRKQTNYGISSKFTFEYTASQCIGEINYIGFSHQYDNVINRHNDYRFDHCTNRYKITPQPLYYSGDKNGLSVQDPFEKKYVWCFCPQGYLGQNNLAIVRKNILDPIEENLYIKPPWWPTGRDKYISEYTRIIIDGNNYYYLFRNKLYRYSKNFEILLQTFVLPYNNTCNNYQYAASRTNIINNVLYVYQPENTLANNDTNSLWHFYSINLSQYFENNSEGEISIPAFEKIEDEVFKTNSGNIIDNETKMFNYAELFNSNQKYNTYVGISLNLPNSNYKLVSVDNRYDPCFAIIDFENKKIIGFTRFKDYGIDIRHGGTDCFINLPINQDTGLWCGYEATPSSYSSPSPSTLKNLGAISAFKLPETITKTREHAMTVTYEIEVRWLEKEKGE